MGKILVVEDSPTQAAKLELYLLEHGFEPILARDGEAALLILERERCEAVISDIVMPGLSGYDLCRKIKATEGLKDIPVILLTSLRDPMDIVLGLEAGADNFFTKPYEPEQLIKRVSSILENRLLAAEGKLRVGFEVAFLGRRFAITSDRQQILDLLISTFEQIIETNQQLERSKQEIALARDQAEAATQAKANFLAAMSHEIRTPMNGIVGMVDLLAEGELTEDQRKMIGAIKTSAYSLLGIIGDILDFSRLEARRMKLEHAKISIQEVLESVGIGFWPSVTDKSLSLPMFCDPRIPRYVLGDEVRVRQILSNLIGNALKFTKTTAERAGQVEVRAEFVTRVAGRVKVRFVVADNGIGMSEETRTRLFQPFEQADASTVREYGGTGLGLSICRQIVSLMGGEIGFESELGVGTTFTAELWFDDTAERDEFADLQRINVLQILRPEETRIGDFATRYIEFWGGRSDVVYDPDEGVKRLLRAAAAREPFQVVVLSAQDTAGGQAAFRDKVISIPALSQTRFVFMSADYQRTPRLASENTMAITAAPLCYATYVTAIAVAVGRASPATQRLVEQKPLPAVQAPSVEEAARNGQLILVAEDNEINQTLVQRQLAILGYAGVIVGDGQQALEAYQTGRYSLLLTDCHMPKMDGYRLTSAIREAEHKTGAHIPIIAITANALYGEAERCLKIGMDDFIVKPVELRAFRDKLAKWMPPPKSDVAEKSAPTVKLSDGTNAEVLDVSVLERLVSGDQEAVRSLLGGFEKIARRSVAQIQDALNHRSREDVAFGAHALKGAARTIGALPLAEICVKLETAAQTLDWQSIGQLVSELNVSMEAVIERVDARLRAS